MIHLVATAVKHGKGGISTALVSFCESPQLQQHGLNVIESHRGTSGKFAAYRAAAARLRNEVQAGDIVWLHCARWLSMLRKYLLARVAKRRGAVVVMQFHSAVTADYLASPWRRWLLRRLVNVADGICVLTPWWRDLLIARLGLAPERVHVVPNTLDAQFLAAAPAARIGADEPIRLLCMTRLVPGKNVHSVIGALLQLPEQYQLSIAGEGADLTLLQGLVTRFGLQSRVTFLGWVDYADKIAVLQQHHLFVLPSAFDAFGMGFIEAMAVGLPVVALAHGPTPDVVPHQQAGYLVERGDSRDLADAIRYCTEHHAQLSTQARAYVQQQFAVEPVVADLQRFFAACAARASAGSN